MVQNILILISMFLVTFFADLRDQKIVIGMDAPLEVQAGSEIIVTLTIDKGDIESFSRYTQSLPYGLTAVRMGSYNADFSFSEQRVRIIWLKLPPKNKLVVKYKIQVDPRLTGIFDLKGNFAFVQSNQRRSIDVDAGHPIIILPNPEIARAERIDINDYQRIAFKELQKETGEIRITRSDPIKLSPFEYKVDLTVRKGDLSKFAKIEDYIPEGFRVVEGNSQNGIFRFNQGLVKILWMNLPAEQEFSISYTVVPDPGVEIKNFHVKGSFSYITGNETKSVEILEEIFSPTVTKKIQQEETEVSQTSDSLLAKKDIPDNSQDKEKEEMESPLPTEKKLTDADNSATDVSPKIQEEEVIASEPMIPEENQKEEQEDQTIVLAEKKSIEAEPEKKKISTQKKPKEKLSVPMIEKESSEIKARPLLSENSYMLMPEKGVYYRVQLAAGHKKVNIKKYFSRRNITDEIKMEFHEGWRKYTTGSFYIYKDARDYRIKIRNTTPVKGAFITAYNEGNRITVQEAIMLSGNKWYR